MSSHRFLFASWLGLACIACGEPNCPTGYMKYGDQCRRCPPGEERERGRCVAVWDGSVESVVEDQPNGDESNYDELESDSAQTPSTDDAGRPDSAAEDDGSAPMQPSVDCNSAPDDETHNACGGPCSAQLEHQSGDACDNGLKGACLRTGTYECDGETRTRCRAPMIAASSERCGDSIDNDCDGDVDEDDSVDATIWYEDCDGDGYSGSPRRSSPQASAVDVRAQSPLRFPRAVADGLIGAQWRGRHGTVMTRARVITQACPLAFRPLAKYERTSTATA